MPAAQSKQQAKSGTPRSGASESKAVALLKADHRKHEKLFAAYEVAKSSKDKREIATQVCTELRHHMEMEEQVFFPFVRERMSDTHQVTEALVEHQSAKELMAQLDEASEVDETFDARMDVLEEHIEHHVEEEEEELFPQLKRLKPELDALAEEMEAFQANLANQTVGKEEASLHGYPPTIAADAKQQPDSSQ
jgi:hemerythrin-like domain-containing protein